MKKSLITLSVIVVIALTGLFTTTKTESIVNTTLKTDKMGRQCGCGGDMVWKANAYTVKVKCSACNGTGVLVSGKYRTTCNTCKGSGQIDMPKSGYVCKSCGKIEKD